MSNDEGTARQGSSAPLLLAACAIVLVAHAYMGSVYFRDLWRRPHYQFFPLAYLGMAWLTYARTRTMGALESGNSWLVGALLIAQSTLIGASLLFASGWIAGFAIFALTPILIYAVGSWKLLKRLTPVWLLMLLTLRPPLSLDTQLVTYLQFLTSQWGSMILDAFSVVHRTAGNVLKMPKGEYFVEEACSGINSLLTVLTATLFYAVFMRWGYIRTTLMVLAGVVWVMIANLTRVVGVAVLAGLYELPIDKGTPHDIYGFVLFFGTLGLLWSTDQFFAAILPESLTEEPAPFPDEGPTTLTGVGVAPIPGIAVALVFLGLLAVQGMIIARSPALGSGDVPEMVEKDFPPRGASGRSLWAPWRRVGFATVERKTNSRYGKHSRVWAFQHRDKRLSLSFDYPFIGWHDMSICYRGEGWQILKARTSALREDAPGDVVELSLEKSGRHALVLFTCFDGRVQPLERPSAVFRQAQWGKLQLRLEALKRALNGEADTPLVDRRTTYQLQVYVESFDPIDEVTRKRAHAQLRQAFTLLERKWKDGPK